MSEGVLEAQLARHAGDDDGVGQRLARRLDQLRQVGHPPLRVGHDAVLLGPLRRREEHVGEARGLGRVVGVLDDDELGLAERLLDEIKVRHGRRGVGAEDPDRADGTVEEPLEDLERRPSRRRRDPSLRRAPVALDHGARRRVTDLAVAGKQVRQASRLAAAHGVRLPSQRERPRAGPADLPGRKVQVQDRRVLVGADMALVDAHAPERHRRARPAEPARRGGDDFG